MHDLYWNNRLVEPSINFGYFNNLEEHTFLKYKTNPYFLWNSLCQKCDLHSLLLSTEEQQYFNNVGLEIYLIETTSLILKSRYCTEFDSSVTHDELRSVELDIISIFVKNNNLTNVKVFTCEYRSSLLNFVYPLFEIVCLDLYIRVQAFLQTDTFNFKNKIIQKKFQCSNWRYASHRYIVISYLCNYDGFYSWYYQCTAEDILTINWFDPSVLGQNYWEKIEQGVDRLATKNFLIDNHASLIKTDTMLKPKKDSKITDALKSSVKNSFCSVVTETRYAQPFANFSEKTFRAIKFLTPFVLVAPPRTLEYLQKLGFKTFDKWWDESYDQETNHTLRLTKIFSVIDYIESKSFEELELIYKEMYEVLIHNQKHLSTFSYNLHALP